LGNPVLALSNYIENNDTEQFSAVQGYRSESPIKPPPGSRWSGWGIITPAVTIQAAKEIKSPNPSVKEVLNMAES
jgi:hypothetical protein